MKIERQKYIPQYGLGIDWETSGSNFDGKSEDLYQGLSFGAVIFDTLTLEEVDSLYVEIKFDATKYKWSDEAEKIHGMSREYLEENGVTREEALVMLLEFLMKWMGPQPGKIMFLGHNADFDVQFTKQLGGDHGLEFEVYHVRLDSASAGFITMGIYKSDAIFELFNGVERTTHNALEDIRLTLNSIRGMREIFQIGLETLNNS